MIDEAFEFDASEEQVIKSYKEEHLSTVKHEFWGDAACGGLKSRCKNYYIMKQKYKCCYCQQEIIVKHGRQWDLDHIVPKSVHPEFLFVSKNLAISCIDCNLEKSDKETLVNPKRKTYPNNGSAFLIFHPHFDNYEQNIMFIPGRMYIGTTPKGKETVRVCNLTRFSFEYLGWLGSLAKEEIMEIKMNEYLSSTEEAKRQLLLLELSIILKVHL